MSQASFAVAAPIKRVEVLWDIIFFVLMVMEMAIILKVMVVMSDSGIHKCVYFIYHHFSYFR